MGKCGSKGEGKEKVRLEEYVKGIRMEERPKRPTIVAFQSVEDDEIGRVRGRVTVEGNVIKKTQMIGVVVEACKLNEKKIYMDYFRYFDSRKMMGADKSYRENYIDAVVSQISLLNRNIKRFPLQLASNFLITERVYKESFDVYSGSKQMQNAVIKSFISAFKLYNTSYCLPEPLVIEAMNSIFNFWNDYLSQTKILTARDIVLAKGSEAEFLISELSITEVGLTLSLDLLGFYSKPVSDSILFLKKTYKNYMKQVFASLPDRAQLSLSGPLGLIRLKETQ
jgi:hypothetical protein